ncbi:39S ribosomal protein L33, mitochondrial isoform X1 [Gopherus flavomarginatus]|uniref:39S ribosomal protein L33, mitochondrial isoform X2 n=1 Tax=Gopherus evgoodei TaxID=1825980 RepID=UPI0011D02E24|nr:39S ribosomal protein L33, mitochondrial isoform X2 [Gopherus evgoodei]XP_050804623.1 39S ribosomal protein L33, mitochondrial isoform X1 [Gopherus flavomarginatus]
MMGEIKLDVWHSLPIQVAKKAKSKYILVRMVSAAGTGYCYNIKRARLQEKLVLLKYDPIVNQRVLFTEKRKIRSI